MSAVEMSLRRDDNVGPADDPEGGAGDGGGFVGGEEEDGNNTLTKPLTVN